MFPEIETLSQPSHPAKFSDEIIEDIAFTLSKYKFPTHGVILDPFAGTGKISRLRNNLNFPFTGQIICNDIDDWGNAHSVEFYHVDSEILTLSNKVGAIITSPTYGNRMADHFEPKDDSKRYTYRLGLGKDLNPENTGRMHFGDKYKEKHKRIYKNVSSLLAPAGLFIVNVSDFIRNKTEIVPVNDFHHQALVELGYDLLNVSYVKTRRMRNGRNGQSRVDHEVVFTFRKPEL